MGESHPGRVACTAHDHQVMIDQDRQLWTQWQALQASAAASAAAHPSPAANSDPSLPADKPQLHEQLPHLAQRLGQVLAPVIRPSGQPQSQAPDQDQIGSDQIAPAAAGLDALAAEAAQRALELRGLTAKGARLRKKKALTDLLEALQAAGASRHVSAVPAAQRTVHSWFAQVRFECNGTVNQETQNAGICFCT